jgi:hypothetical protein
VHMINPDDHPVQWALWIEEFNEAHEHLGAHRHGPRHGASEPVMGTPQLHQRHDRR